MPLNRRRQKSLLLVNEPVSTRMAIALERTAEATPAPKLVIAEWQPDEAAVEETFVNADARATLKLGQARAIALLVPAEAGVSVAEYAPRPSVPSARPISAESTNESGALPTLLTSSVSVLRESRAVVTDLAAFKFDPIVVGKQG